MKSDKENITFMLPLTPACDHPEAQPASLTTKVDKWVVRKVPKHLDIISME